MARRYGSKASEKVREAMRERKAGGGTRWSRASRARR
jgi:hypothetical protein